MHEMAQDDEVELRRSGHWDAFVRKNHEMDVREHCLSRSCLRGSKAGDKATAQADPMTFDASGCECRCHKCV